MDDILQRSTLLNNFSDEEKLETRQYLTKRYEAIYNDYINTYLPDEAMMEKVIDMYLYLGTTPSERLSFEVRYYLLKGITFSKLDIYAHVPDDYQQIVKLLRPEYYTDVKPGLFYVFSHSKVIKEIAEQRYGLTFDQNIY